MTTALTTLQQIDYDAQIKAAYGSGSILRNCVRVKSGVIGASTTFRKYNRVVASPRIYQAPVVAAGHTGTPATANLSPWEAADYLDKQEQTLVNYSEAPLLMESLGKASGRRVDQIIIDALSAAKGSADIAHGSTGFTYAKFTQLNKLFNKAGVPMGDRHLLIEAEGEEDFINEAKFTSADYISKAVIESGKLPPVLFGCHIHVLDNARDEGGLPLSGSTQTCFAWDRVAMGFGENDAGGETSMAWVPQFNSWLFAHFIRAGAVAIDTAGIFEIEYTV